VQPVYIPKLFLAMLRPFHSLRELLPAKTESAPSPPPAQPPVKSQ
jgi:hypothetical protein